MVVMMIIMAKMFHFYYCQRNPMEFNSNSFSLSLSGNSHTEVCLSFVGRKQQRTHKNDQKSVA